MSETTVWRTLFAQWERVWHHGEYDLVASCVGPHYIRHEEAGVRTVTREAYAQELALVRASRPGVRILVYDHDFVGSRAWFRFAFSWVDPVTGQPISQAGMQSYRLENGKLAETWLSLRPVGSTWSDTPQVSWTQRTATP